jgi:hypothetical protein
MSYLHYLLAHSGVQHKSCAYCIIRKSKKETAQRLNKGQRANNDLQNTTIKLKIEQHEHLLKPG